MGILSWIIIELMVGLMASAFSKRHGFRKLSILLVSVIGAAIGGMNVAFLYKVPGALYHIIWPGMLAAFVGALFAIALLNLLNPHKRAAV